VPYENKRYGHKHLSITVQDDGQIQQLSETEAGFRMASISTAPPPQGTASANPAATAPAAAAVKPASLKPKSPKPKSLKPKSSRSRGASSHKPAGQRKPALATTTVQQGVQPSTGLLAWIRRWIW
jgi:hypothetical protein